MVESEARGRGRVTADDLSPAESWSVGYDTRKCTMQANTQVAIGAFVRMIH